MELEEAVMSMYECKTCISAWIKDLDSVST